MIITAGRQVVIGLGMNTRATADDVAAALSGALTAADCGWAEVREIATIDRHRGHSALAELRVPLRFLPASALANARPPNPSAPVARAVGASSVAEAAALIAANATTLRVPKHCSATVCVAVADVP